MSKFSIVKNGVMASGGKGEISQDSLDKINAFTEKIMGEQKGLDEDIVKHVNDNLFDLLSEEV